MKIIEAMKRIKEHKVKVADLQDKIAKNCANLSHETPVYGPDTRDKITAWLQSCTDLSQENVRLLCAIQKTNMNTPVTVELGGIRVTKTIAEWVWRRREYAALDMLTWGKLTDRGLREGHLPSSVQGQQVEVKIQRHYDPELRDKSVALYRDEPGRIDAALEIINAVTDLMED